MLASSDRLEPKEGNLLKIEDELFKLIEIQKNKEVTKITKKVSKRRGYTH